DVGGAYCRLVMVSFWPFNSSDPAIGLTLRLLCVIIAVAITGVVAGGSATWFRQRHWRRAARQHEADARQARAQLADLRGGGTARGDPQRYPALPPQGGLQGGLYGSSGRDKQGATL